MPARSFRDEPVEKSTPSDWSRHLLASHPAEAQGERLVLAGAKVVVPPPPAATLWRALEDLDEGRAEKLLQKASEEEVNRRGGPYASTPLGWVAQAGSTRLARTLLARSADPNIAAEKGSLPLHMAAWNGDNVELAQLLLEAGAKPDAQNAQGQTALEVATSLDELERSSPWLDVFDTSQWLVHIGNRPTGRPRLIVALSEVMGVTPSATVVEAAAAAAQALSQASLPAGAGAGKADGDDSMAVDGAPEANPEAGAEAAEDEASQEEAVVEELGAGEASAGQPSE